MIITKGSILRQYRENAGISQRQLSRQIGIPRGTISSCELKNLNIDRKTAKIYDKFFRVKKSFFHKLIDFIFS